MSNYRIFNVYMNNRLEKKFFIFLGKEDSFLKECFSKKTISSKDEKYYVVKRYVRNSNVENELNTKNFKKFKFFITDKVLYETNIPYRYRYEF